MKSRKRISYGRSRKIFTKGAQRIHPKNGIHESVMRGGIRL